MIAAMQLAPLAVVLFSFGTITSTADAEPPKVGETYSCVLTFTVSTWSKTGVKEKAVKETQISELIKVLDGELEVTLVSRDSAMVLDDHLKTGQG